MWRSLVVVVGLLLATACGGGEQGSDSTDQPVVAESTLDAAVSTPSEATEPPPSTAASTEEVCALLHEVDRQDRRTDRVLERAVKPLLNARTPEKTVEAFDSFLRDANRYLKVALRESRPTYRGLRSAVPPELKRDVETVQKFSETFIADLAAVETPQQLQQVMVGNQAAADELGQASERLDGFSVDTCGFSIAS